MSAFGHVTAEHARCLARAVLIGAGVMLCLLGGVFLAAASGGGDPHDPHGAAYAGMFGVALFEPYTFLLLLAAGILRRWPRAGHVAHIPAWNWPLVAIVGAAAASMPGSHG